MAGKRRSKRRVSRQQMMSARLDLIRRRYRELILQPRETIAADLDCEFGDTGEAEELQLARSISLERL